MDDLFQDERFLARWLAGELKEEELQKFQAHPDFPKYQQLLRDTEQFSIPAIDEEAILQKIKTQQSNQSAPKEAKTFRLLRKAWIPAASILLILSAYLIFFSSTEMTLQTLAGEQLEHVLPDQSKIILHADAQITYDYQEYQQKRIIHLQGEAFFEVLPGAPFQVNTDQGQVRVLGTSFVVMSENNEFLVSCKTGRVEVALSTGDPRILEKGQRVRKVNQQLSPPETIDPQLIGQWQSGESRFKSEPLKNVVRALEKQFDIRIQISSQLDAEKFTGSFLHRDLDQALKMVFAPMELKYELVDGVSQVE